MKIQKIMSGKNHFYDKPRGKSTSKSRRVSNVKDWVEGRASEGLKDSSCGQTGELSI